MYVSVSTRYVYIYLPCNHPLGRADLLVVGLNSIQREGGQQVTTPSPAARPHPPEEATGYKPRQQVASPVGRWRRSSGERETTGYDPVLTPSLPTRGWAAVQLHHLERTPHPLSPLLKPQPLIPTPTTHGVTSGPP